VRTSVTGEGITVRTAVTGEGGGLLRTADNLLARDPPLITAQGRA
jgi:hypothetical protein